MLPALLGSAAGAAAVTIGRGAAAALGNGLSFAAELAKAAGNPGLDPKAAKNDDGGLPADLRQRIGDLAVRIRRHLAAAGIRLAQPVELVSDRLGGMAIAGGHPQQAAIEQVLGSDVLLERDFNRLAADYHEQLGQHDAARLSAPFKIPIA
jgi:hypothetical protein